MRGFAKIIARWLNRRGLPEWLALAAHGAGLGALLLAALSAWYRVPDVTALDGSLRAQEPAITWLFRVLCLGVVAGKLAPRSRANAGSRAASVCLAATLLFPTAVLFTAPHLAARGAWLWAQHDELTGYAGDIYTSQEVRDAEWQQRTVVVDEPIANRIAKPPAWSPANIEWGRLLEVAEWFGLSAWFGQCLARGWMLAIAGSILLLVADLAQRLRDGETPEKARPPRGLSRVLGAAAALLFMAVVARYFACAHRLATARDLARSGEAAAALAVLQRAAELWPALREDGAFYLQVGRLESALHRATPAAALDRARRLAEDGFTQQACDAMLAELTAAPPGSAAQRELVKSLLSHAIAELNSGQPRPAIALLEAVLAADPTHLKANYTMQLACVRTGRLEELRQLAARMRETYRFLNTPTKRSVLAAAHEHLAAAELAAGAPAQALAQWRLAKRPSK
jgi:tetratricopeptide (TPR) repeat protein